MLEMIQSLFKHQEWADAAMLQAVRALPDAEKDEKMLWTLHHIVVVQRAFLSLFVKRPFDMQKEMQAPESFADLERLFRDSHTEELAFVGGLQDAELARIVDMPWIPDCRLTLGQGLMQVVMHSQGHRGQCLARLRVLGGTPPTLDFILWLKDHRG